MGGKSTGGKNSVTKNYANLSHLEIKQGIKKLENRIQDLKNFNASAISSHEDPKIKLLSSSIKQSLASIYGVESLQYNQYLEAARIDRTNYTALILNNSPMPTLEQLRNNVRYGVSNAIELLEHAQKTLIEEYDLHSFEEQSKKTVFTSNSINTNSKVFVVHGHDGEAKLSVARLIEKIGLTAIILHEKSDQGRTIIEKFNDHANEANFAVVLLTPDDLGGPTPKKEKDNQVLKPRARQNVILELGFFIGKLGRQNVCALHKGAIEIPTDYHGVLYKQMDDAGAWETALAIELKTAGLDVDLNNLV